MGRCRRRSCKPGPVRRDARERPGLHTDGLVRVEPPLRAVLRRHVDAAAEDVHLGRAGGFGQHAELRAMIHDLRVRRADGEPLRLLRHGGPEGALAQVDGTGRRQPHASPPLERDRGAGRQGDLRHAALQPEGLAGIQRLPRREA